MIFSRDTSLEADRVMVELLRRATVGRKWIMLDQQCDLVRSLARSGLRMRYPEADTAEIEARLYDLILGPEVGPRVLAAKRAPARTWWSLDGAPLASPERVAK